MIFVDVGAHEGQTLQEVTKLRYGFTHIYALEPMPAQYKILQTRYGRDPRVTLLNYGLADFTDTTNIYGTNDGMEASLYPDKQDVDADVVTRCWMVEAAMFFKLMVREQRAVVKLNCEGGEIPILDSLIDSGEIWKCAEVLIDFDIRKVPGYHHEEDRILHKLRTVGFDRYHLSEEVMIGPTHQQRIANWLASL